MRRVVDRVGRLQRLAVFEAAARLGSFSAAARDLEMTQPAVTRHIRSLERALGAMLFTRSSNRSELTAAGTRLQLAVGAGFDAIEQGLRAIDATNGVFVLGASPGLAEQVLVPNLEHLQNAIGDRDLRLWLSDRDSDLSTDGFDAAARFGTGAWPGLQSRLLIPEVVVPVAAPALAVELELDQESAAAAVAGAPLLHGDQGDRQWMSWTTWLGTFGLTDPTGPRRVVFNNYPMVLRQALAGNGVALGWRVLVDELVETGMLTVVGPEVRTRHGYYLTWAAGPTALRATRLADALIALLADRQP